ncbi:hypothetical protein JYU34_006395 [Plutella xylostella]|uniref:Uncharacterized protein n=1 Tax=Plutella xylostella TaxID=51655 RepID=A0ABQ7PQK5_PLUXY|nr:hypothetical protein JYU34_022939 [Plutella xylostella]KAG7307800.1 hypothetical protein JYU34_006395 [Plutella xylostella]
MSLLGQTGVWTVGCGERRWLPARPAAGVTVVATGVAVVATGVAVAATGVAAGPDGCLE